uniref:ABC-type xenobiotic transporter n=1 Tax=Culicoides sonorensis TaxID=179676 RepID=A0A336LJ59_CULSO
MVELRRDSVFSASSKGLQKILKTSKSNKNASVPYHKLYQFATPFQLILVFIGMISSVLSSLGIPFIIVLYGEFTTILVDRVREVETSTPTLILSWFGGGRILVNATTEENRAEIVQDSKAYGLGSLCVGLFQLTTMAISVYVLNLAAQKQICAIRKKFFQAVLRQDQSWYDLNQNDSFAVKLNEDLERLKEGIGEKVVMFVYLIATFVFSIIFAFIYGWKLTLVILSCSPIIIVSTAYVAKMQTSLTEKELESYSSAGSVAEEVLSAVKTVFAFSGQAKEVERYSERLIPAEKNGIKKAIYTGSGGGIMWLIIYLIYALAFWYGMALILEDRDKEIKEYTPAALIIILFGVLSGAQNLGLTLPHLEAFNVARASAASIFSVIARKPEIDSLSQDGVKPELLKGNITFSNIHFRYPARSDVVVLNGLDLTIKAGETTALVGMSGCGKSTLLQLLQRLYDPLHGFIEIDGIRLKDINTYKLRSFMGFVGQEPVLFDTSIAENIRYGFPEATQDQIENAARIANCHKFIAKLPQGYSTQVGQRGAQLSGGQKQRIAIARAIIRDPSILLLDEATSALDPTSERRVQHALEKASQGRTTIVISHRLSTIVDADKIVVIDKGVVVEEGTHNELMKAKGAYYSLVIATADKNQENDEPLDDDEKLLTKRAELLPPESVEYLRANSRISISETSSSQSESDSIVKEKYSAPLSRLLRLNSPEWHYLLLGSISAAIVGASIPAFAVLFGGIYGLLALPDDEEIRQGTNFYSILFIVLGIVTGLATFFQTFSLNVAGVRLTKRLRQTSFKSMLEQEIAWYDEPKNSIGELSARLSGDCAQVQGALGTRIGYVFQAIAIIIVGVGVALYYSWKLTLVSIIAVPVTLTIVFIESKFMTSSEIEEKKSIETATKIAVEAISNIKTIACLGQEPYVLKRYEALIDDVTKTCLTKIRFRGPVYATGQTVPMLGYALALWYGGILISQYEMSFEDVIKVSEALLFGAWMMGQALAYAPNVNSALDSAGRILNLLDRRPNIFDPVKAFWHDQWVSEGNLTYEDVRFRYPTRPTVEVLQGFDLEIQRGQTVALVGHSGCGKSTIIQLLLRYYDLDQGKIILDNRMTTELPIELIRSQLGLVSQEPTLFDRTIAENIAYGDNNAHVTMDQIMDAAKKANIHEFITRLPQGYETGLGSKGAQLSGGQKQRIAIARALVRNPRILLLDEATSALDNQSEKVVQEALDHAREGRTCITIAHRLSTIKNADMICVVQDGKIVEKGTHKELISFEQGIYAKLYEMQKIM